MSSNPIDQIGGLASSSDTNNVDKGQFIAWGKARLAQVMTDADEIRATDLAGQLMVTLLSTARLYKLDTIDGTTADDGVNCIISNDGLRFKLVTINGIDGVDGTSALTRVRAVDTTGGAVATAYAAGQTVDGVTLVQNDLVLRATSGGDSADGVYVVPASGAASRDGSFDTYDKHPGTFFSVEEGTANADTLWQCTSDKGGALGVDAIAITEFKSGVQGPASSTDNYIPQWNGTGGNALRAGLMLDTDGTFAANSDTRLASQKAVKTFVLANTTALTNLITPEQYGAKGDVELFASGMAISASSPNLTISGRTPAAADVGKTVAIDGAGASGACFVTTVSSISGSNFVLAASASTTVASAAGEMGTDDTDALQAMAAACANKSVWFGPGKIYYHKDNASATKTFRFSLDSFVIFGNRAIVRAMPNADGSTTGIHFTDSTWAGTGPNDFRVYDLFYNGNRTRRVSSGALSGVGQASAFYAVGVTYAHFIGCHTDNTVSDGFYIGGGHSGGPASTFYWFERCVASDAGRNGFSFVGAQYGSLNGCLSENHSYGAGHSNISTGYDWEPDASASQNSLCLVSQCVASSCATEGFASHNSLGPNTHVVWGHCYAEACGTGFYETNAGATKVFAASYSGNTTNFSGVTEKISGF